MVFNRDKKKEGIFRQESLERLSSPERLDQLMQVVSPKDWLALTVFGSLTIIGLVWSIFGRIPVTVEGRGVFTQPRRVVEFQSSIAGQLKSLNVQSGQCIKKDEILATVDPTDLRQQLQLARDKLAQVQRQDQEAFLLSSQRMQREKSVIEVTRLNLQQRINDTRTLTPVLKQQELDAIRQQRQGLEERLKDAEALVPVMQKRLEQRKMLASQGAISKDVLLQSDQEYVKARQSVGEILGQLKQLDAQSSQAERRYLGESLTIGDLNTQLQELDTKAKRLDLENLESSNQRKKEIQEISREITRLEQQVAQNSRILATQDGCILELTTTLGQVVQPGSRLGTIRIGRGDESPIGLSYFAVKDGKQLKPGMSILITPDTVQRERFGGIVGKITRVSPLPVTPEGTVSVIGNAEVVKNLIGEKGAAIEVNANLLSDSSTFSGYKWSSSKGPNLKITSGTTATVRVTVEERAPITFVLPILRELAGMK